MAVAIAVGLLGVGSAASKSRRKTLPNCSGKLLFFPLAAKTDFPILFMKKNNEDITQRRAGG